MSNLLEQAIIDAAALRETALKSAEAALIEKYKDEFQESLEKLLEQEDAAAPPPEMSAMPSPDMGMEAAPQEQPGGEALEEVPSSFLDGDDEELITIDFDKLEKQLSDALESPMLATPEEGEEELAAEPAMDLEQPALQEELELELDEVYDAGGQKMDTAKDSLYEEDDESDGDSLEEEEALDEEIVISLAEDEGDLEESEDPNQQIARKQQEIAQRQQEIAGIKAKAAQANAAEKEKGTAESEPANDEQLTDMSEEFELTEEEIQELAEEMHVDLYPENQSRGHMGSTTVEKKLNKDVALAAARDDDEVERRKKEEERAKDLECKLDEAKSENSRLNILVEELKDNLIVLKEHTEKLSVSNAKLLYINKVFGNSSLNERQKQNIVESISQAQSVLEAKTIYGTLQSTLESVSFKKPKQSLGEAINRESVGFISRPKTTSMDVEFADRLKILAGIKNKT